MLSTKYIYITLIIALLLPAMARAACKQTVDQDTGDTRTICVDDNHDNTGYDPDTQDRYQVVPDNTGFQPDQSYQE